MTLPSSARTHLVRVPAPWQMWILLRFEGRRKHSGGSYPDSGTVRAIKLSDARSMNRNSRVTTSSDLELWQLSTKVMTLSHSLRQVKLKVQLRIHDAQKILLIFDSLRDLTVSQQRRP